MQSLLGDLDGVYRQFGGALLDSVKQDKYSLAVLKVQYAIECFSVMGS